MKYEYMVPDRVQGVWKDEQGCLWEYGDREGTVFGEVRRKSKVESQSFLHDDAHQIPVTPLQKRRGMFERVVGYIPCACEGERGCVCIVAPGYGRMAMIAVALCIMVAGVIYFMSRDMAEDKTDEVIHVELPDSMQNTDPGSYTILDYTSIRKDVNKEKTDTWLINVSDNPYDISYEIYLKGESQSLYSSPILGEGDMIQGMTLKKDLEVGEYEYTIVCTLYSSETQEEIGEQTMEGVLEVYG